MPTNAPKATRSRVSRIERPEERQRTVTGAVTYGTGDGPPKRPHDRSGHQRRLQDGRVVKVRACEIHKGAVTAPLHSVVRP